MTLYDELYFDINIEGAKSDIEKLVLALEDGALDDYFEFNADQIEYDDDFYGKNDDADTSISFSNVDIGIEIDELSVYDLLDELCRIGKRLELRGEIYDADDDEYRFISHRGESYYINADKAKLFEEDLNSDEEDEDEESED